MGNYNGNGTGGGMYVSTYRGLNLRGSGQSGDPQGNGQFPPPAENFGAGDNAHRPVDSRYDGIGCADDGFGAGDCL